MIINEFRGTFWFLSNFYPAAVEYGIWFPSVEHAYQAAKTADLEKRLYISKLRTAREAKAAGRQVTLRPDWNDQTKLQVMYYLLQQKFKRGTKLHALLQATNDAELVEGNDWGDVYWGVCNGKGENHLGKLLMKIRAETK